jgi:hypothetical protein
MKKENAYSKRYSQQSVSKILTARDACSISCGKYLATASLPLMDINIFTYIAGFSICECPYRLPSYPERACDACDNICQNTAAPANPNKTQANLTIVGSTLMYSATPAHTPQIILLFDLTNFFGSII